MKNTIKIEFPKDNEASITPIINSLCERIQKKAIKVGDKFEVAPRIPLEVACDFLRESIVKNDAFATGVLIDLVAGRVNLLKEWKERDVSATRHKKGESGKAAETLAEGTKWQKHALAIVKETAPRKPRNEETATRKRTISADFGKKSA